MNPRRTHLPGPVAWRIRLAAIAVVAILASGVIPPGLIAVRAAEPAATTEPAPEPAGVEWSDDLQATLAAAPDRPPRPVLLLFTASWCGPCQNLKKDFDTSTFAAAFKDFRFVMIDIDSEEGLRLQKEWDATNGIPDVRFISEKGVEIGGFQGYAPGNAVKLVTAQLAKAREWEAREAILRTAADGDPTDPVARLRLAEHLLQRPSKAAALDALRKAAELDADNRAGCAARADWLIAGTLLNHYGRASAESRREVAARLQAFDTFASRRDGAQRYRDCIDMWLLLDAEMKRWVEERGEKAGGENRPPEFATDSPLCRAIEDLEAADPDGGSDDCIADAMFVHGFLDYLSGDYDAGIRRLGEFTERFASHRWIEEGHRYLVVCRRLKAKAEPVAAEDSATP